MLLGTSLVAWAIHGYLTRGSREGYKSADDAERGLFKAYCKIQDPDLSIKRNA